MDGYESNAPVAIAIQESCEDALAEFLRTGRIIGGPERCAFLCDRLGDPGTAPGDIGL